MRPVHRVQSEHLLPLRSLAVPVQRQGTLRVVKACGVVATRQRRVGGFEVGAEDTAAIRASQGLGPVGVWFIFEDLAARQRQRFPQPAERDLRWCPPGLVEQLIEAVEVDRRMLDAEPVAVGLGDHQLTRAVAVSRQAPAQDRHKRVERSGWILREPLTPEQVGKPLRRHPAPPRCEEDLEHLFRSASAEVARPECAPELMDGDRAEQSDSDRRLRPSPARLMSSTVAICAPCQPLATACIGETM